MRDYVKVADNIWQEQTTIDWEQRRYEIAKAIMQSYMAQCLETFSYCTNDTRYAKNAAFFAVRCADALIEELQKVKE